MSDPHTDEPTVADAPAFGARRPPPDERGYHPFLALLLLVFSGVTWFGFQCHQLLREKEALATAFANQTQKFEDSAKLRSAVEGLVRDTTTLASKGNQGAKLVVDELARRGVTFGTASQAPAASK